MRQTRAKSNNIVYWNGTYEMWKAMIEYSDSDDFLWKSIADVELKEKSDILTVEVHPNADFVAVREKVDKFIQEFYEKSAAQEQANAPEPEESKPLIDYCQDEDLGDPIKVTVVEEPDGAVAGLLTMINHRDKSVSFSVESYVYEDDDDDDLGNWVARARLVFFVDGEKYEVVYDMEASNNHTREEALKLAEDGHEFLVSEWGREGQLKMTTYQHLVDTFVAGLPSMIEVQ